MDAFKYVKPKLFSTPKNYTDAQFAKDLVVRIIMTIIALPLSIALAVVLGVDPEQGLYTTVVVGSFTPFLGDSRIQIGGPAAAFVVIICGIITRYGMAGLTIAIFLAGIMIIIMGLLRSDDLIKFIPKTIIVDLTLGIAVGILVGQLRDFFGLSMGAVPTEFAEKMVVYAQRINTIHWPTLLIGLIALLIQIFWPRVSQRIPGSLVTIIVTTAIVGLGYILSVETVGDLYIIKAGLPTFTIPQLSFSLIRQMISPTFTITILASIESLLSRMASGRMIGSHHHSNVELVGQGVGSMMPALFGGIPAAGAIAHTAANVKDGERTPVADMIHAVTLLLILLFLVSYASLIPMSCLASILIMVAYNVSGRWTFVRMLKKASKSDIAVLVITLILTVFFDLVVTIEFGMVLAAFLFLKRISNVAAVCQWVDRDSLDDNELPESIDLEHVPNNTVIYKIFGSLFFDAANDFLNFNHGEGKNVLILRMRNAPAMDISELEAPEETLEICQRHDMTLVLSHVNKQLYHVIEKAEFIEKVSQENLYENIDTSLKRTAGLA